MGGIEGILNMFDLGIGANRIILIRKVRDFGAIAVKVPKPGPSIGKQKSGMI